LTNEENTADLVEADDEASPQVVDESAVPVNNSHSTHFSQTSNTQESNFLTHEHTPKPLNRKNVRELPALEHQTPKPKETDSRNSEPADNLLSNVLDTNPSISESPSIIESPLAVMEIPEDQDFPSSPDLQDSEPFLVVQNEPQQCLSSPESENEPDTLPKTAVQHALESLEKDLSEDENVNLDLSPFPASKKKTWAFLNDSDSENEMVEKKKEKENLTEPPEDAIEKENEEIPKKKRKKKKIQTKLKARRKSSKRKTKKGKKRRRSDRIKGKKRTRRKRKRKKKKVVCDLTSENPAEVDPSEVARKIREKFESKNDEHNEAFGSSKKPSVDSDKEYISSEAEEEVKIPVKKRKRKIARSSGKPKKNKRLKKISD